MNVREFLEVIYANRDLLGDPTEFVDHRDTHPMSPCKGCPLRAALIVCCPASTHWRQLFMEEKGQIIHVNPDPVEAAHYLQMDKTFAIALANGWDMGVFYDDTEEFELEFSGFLIGLSLRPAPLQLMAG